MPGWPCAGIACENAESSDSTSRSIAACVRMISLNLPNVKPVASPSESMSAMVIARWSCVTLRPCNLRPQELAELVQRDTARAVRIDLGELGALRSSR